MGIQCFELRHMIDSALGHHEKGIVNLNILHSLLHEILNAIDKRNNDSKITRNAKDSSNNENLSERIRDDSEFIDQTSKDHNQQISHENLSDLPMLSNIEVRLKSIEKKFDALDNLSADKNIVNEVRNLDSVEKSQSNKENTLVMMWKHMKVERRIEAAEEAIEEVMNVLNNVTGDVEHLKTFKKDVVGLCPSEEPIVDDEAIKMLNKLGPLHDVVRKKDLASYVTWNTLEQALNRKEKDEDYHHDENVKIQSSQVKTNVEYEPSITSITPKELTSVDGKEPDDTVITKTDEYETSQPLNNNSRVDESCVDKDVIMTHDKDKDSTDQPSSQLLNQLNRIGELPKQYDDVVVQVSMISEKQNKLATDVEKVETDVLPQKLNKADLQLPDNLLEQIDAMRQGLDALNTNEDIQMLSMIKETSSKNEENIKSLKSELAMFSQHFKRLDQLTGKMKSPEAIVPTYDQEVLNNVREKLNRVEEEHEKMALQSKENLDKIIENLDEKQKVIDDLMLYIEHLQQGKADRENVAIEMDVKADKHALDDKVNQSTFEETFQMFDRGLQEALQKMEDYMNEEMTLKDTLKQISQEMEGKIDANSMKLMKDYFEKQIKEVQESRNKIARETHMDTVDAAGIRRKLPVHYHCISCNRPVDVPFRDSEPCLPESEGLPLRKMKIPYTSYEIEQLRQRSLKGTDEDVRDGQSNRPCGGSHTVINPYIRKSTKFHQFSQTMAFHEDPRFIPKMVREVSVLDFLRGSDGHYYKGRTRQILPAIPRRSKYPSNTDAQNNKYNTRDASQGEKSKKNDTHKTGHDFGNRSPSPSREDKLSSSYPERNDQKTNPTQGQRYSCDDLNIPSSLNRESLKILRRKRANDLKDLNRQQCWDQLRNSKGGTENKQTESTSPQSLKRSTPVGEEQPSIKNAEQSAAKSS